MKYAFVVAGALLLGLVTSTAHAQFGIKGGLSYSNVSNQGLLPGTLDHRSGFAVGIALTPSAGRLLGLGVEALFAQRGLTSSTPGESRELNYADVPLYLRAAIPTPGVVPFAYAGPQVSFELSCQSGTGDCPASDRPKTTYAAVLGAGVRIGPTSAFTLEGRYLYGLTDLKLSTVTSSESYKTRSFLILAGFAF